MTRRAGGHIVMVMSDKDDYSLCKKRLHEKGVLEGRDFALLKNYRKAEQYAVADIPQMFVFGPFSKTKPVPMNVIHLVRRLRDKNRRIKTVLLAGSEISQYPFHRRIDPGMGSQRLKTLFLAVQEFVRPIKELSEVEDSMEFVPQLVEA